MLKRFISLLMAVLIVFSVLNINLISFAYEQENPVKSENSAGISDLGGDFTVTQELADSVVSQVFGEAPTPVSTDGGYEYKLSEQSLEKIVDSMTTAAAVGFENTETDGSVDNAREELSNALPEGYIDTSNEVLDKILSGRNGSLSSSQVMRSLSAAPKAKADVVFVIDSTGSMSGAISGVKEYIAQFAEYLFNKGLILRLGLIDYKDITCDGMNSTVVHKQEYSPWITTFTDFIEQLKTVTADGGGDEPETPIDALGYLTDDSSMLWSTDAYKFAVLITDANFKTDNRHGIADLQDIAKRLSDRNIYTSVITVPYYQPLYTDLAINTGGILASLNDNFSNILKSYADAVVSTATAAPVSYSVKITDAVTGLPVEGAHISFVGGSADTGSNGIAVLTSRVNPVKNFEIYKVGYQTYSQTAITLANNMTIPIKLTGGAETGADGTPAFTSDVFINPPSGNTQISAPTVSIFGKQFNLINLPTSLELKFFDKANITIEHDKEGKKFSAIIGADESVKGRYWLDYGLYKNFVQTFTSKTPREIMTDFTRLKGQIKNKSKLLIPITMNVAGYLDASYATGDWKYEGGMVVAAKLEKPIEFSYPIPPAPYVFLKMEINIDAKLKLAIIKVSSAGKAALTCSGELSVTPSLAATLNLGMEKVLYIGGGVSGKLESKLTIPGVFPDRFTMKLLGYWVWEAKIGPLKFSGEQSWGDGIQIYPFTSSRRILATVNRDDGKLIQGPGKAPVLSSAIPPEFIRYDANVYDSGAPQLVQLDNGNLLLVWLGADTSRSMANTSALYYSVYDGTTWTTPALVADDGTADFNPSLFKADDGSVHLVWQDCNRKFSDEDVDLSTYTESVDISYISFDKDGMIAGAEKTITGTTDKVYEAAPGVSACGDSVSVVWLENSENDPLLLNGTSKICRVKIEDGEIKSPEIISQDLAYVTGITAGYTDSTHNVVAYTTGSFSGEDGSLVENPDIYLAGDITEGSRIDTGVSSDEGADPGKINGLQFVGGALYWSDTEGIKTTADVNSPEISLVNNFAADNFKVLKHGENMAIVTLTQGITNEICALYKSADGWTNPVKITNYNKSIHSVSGFLNETDKIYLAFNQVTPMDNSFDGAVSDLVVAGYEKSAPALVVDEGAYFPLSEVAPNNETYVSVYLKNNGATDTPELKAIMTLDSGSPQTISTLYTIPKDKSTFDEKELISSIKAGNEIELLVPMTLPAVLNSSHKLKIEIAGVDPGAVLGASNKVASFEFGASPDVEVVNAAIERTATGAAVTATVRNAGYAQAGKITVEVSDEDSNSFGSKEIIPLDPGAESTLIFEIPESALIARSEYDYKRFIVKAATENEHILSNNDRSVLLAPLPVTGITLDKHELAIAVGEKSKIGYSITPANAGGRDVTWHSDNLSIASVVDGEVTGLSNGTAVITAISGSDGTITDTATVNVTGTSKGVSGITIDQDSLSISVGGSATLSATITPVDAVNKEVVWYSDDSGVVSVVTIDNQGKITGVNEGTARITVVTNDGGYSHSITVTVTKTAKYQLNITSETGGAVTTGISGLYEEGAAIDIAATANNGYRFVKWSSSNGGVFANASSAITKFTMPANGTTIKAGFEAVPPAANPSTVTAAPVKEPDDISVSKAYLDRQIEEKGFAVISVANGRIVLPKATYLSLGLKDGDSLEFSIKPPDKPFKNVLAAYESVLKLNGHIITSFGNNYAILFLKYTGAVSDVNSLIGAYPGSDGSVALFPLSDFDQKNKELRLLTNHLGVFGIKNNAVSFSDTDGHWAKNFISSLAVRGIVDGYGKNKYAPQEITTRAQFARMLVVMAGVDLSKYTTSRFVDVPINQWYASSVEWAAEKGIVDGVGNGRFNPDAPVTREQMAVMILRFAGYMGFKLPASVTEISFADNSKISAWAIDAVKTVQKAGIASGRQGNAFDPRANATRAETAKMIAMLIECLMQ